MNPLIKSIIYDLKRSHNTVCIELFQVLSVAADYANGTKGNTTKSVTVDKAILIPTAYSLDFLLRSIPPSLSANLGLGSLTVSQNVFLLDAKDIPCDWNFDVEGWIILGNEKHSFNRVTNLDGAWVIFTKATPASKLNREIPINIVQYLRMGTALES